MVIQGLKFGAIALFRAFAPKVSTNVAHAVAKQGLKAVVKKGAVATSRHAAVNVFAKKTAKAVALTTTEKVTVAGCVGLGGKMIYDAKKNNSDPKALRSKADAIEQANLEKEEKKKEEKRATQSKKIQQQAIDLIKSGAIEDKKLVEMAAEVMLNQA